MSRPALLPHDIVQPLAYGVSHATSRDGVHWQPLAGNPVRPGAGPSVIRSPQAKGWTLFTYDDSAADKAAIPSVFNPMLGAFSADAATLDGPWVPVTGNATGGRAVAWDGSVATEALGWVATGDAAAGDPITGETRWYYPAFSTVDPPSGWVCPTHTGLEPAVMALSVMVQA